MGLKDHHRYDDDDDVKQVKVANRKYTEFECPGCNANNPTEEFGHKSRVMCNYCGMEWEVRVDDEGKLDFREC